MSDYTDKNILVIGLGRSGIAATSLLHSYGARLTITDARTTEQLAEQTTQLPQGIITHFGTHDFDIAHFDMAVISPGVPWEADLPTRIRQAGIELISELELASRHISAPLIAITGSNGKSTTTCLLGHLLEAAGKRVWIGGNLGEPLTEAIGGEYDWVVAEVSSFQLEGITTFRPKIALLLNITPDHLDRHGSMERYTELKMRISQNQDVGDTLIVNGADPLTAAHTASTQKVHRLTFSHAAANEGDSAYIEGTTAYATIDNHTTPLFDLASLTLPGPSNEENALAAALAALTAGAYAESIQNALGQFRGLPHRMEKVAIIDGITYINDSKGTNVDATIKALAGFQHDVALIAGGSHKGADFSPLATAIRRHTKGVALIGQTARNIADALGDFTPTTFAADMDEAVQSARSFVTAGETVLLSPGCASFDMYHGFAHRGELFRHAVSTIQGEAHHAG